jgi:hypothetical protein
MGAILGDVKLGLDADLPALIEAMTRAMNEMIRKAEEELGIASPSRVFQRIGQQTMTGMAQGVFDMMSIPASSAALAMQRMISAPVMQAPTVLQPIVSRRFDIRVDAGGNSITSGMDERTFETRVTSAVNRALRGERR